MKLKQLRSNYLKQIKHKLKYHYNKILKFDVPKELKKTIKKQGKWSDGYKFSIFANACSDSIARTYTTDEIYKKLIGIKIISDLFNDQNYKTDNNSKKIVDFCLSLFDINHFERKRFLKEWDDYEVQPSIKMLKISDEKKSEYSNRCHTFELFASIISKWLRLASYQEKNLELLFRYFGIYNAISHEKRLKHHKQKNNLYKIHPEKTLEEYRSYFLDKIKVKAMILSKDNFNLIYQAALICE